MNYWLNPYDFSITGTSARDVFYLNQYPKGPVSIDGGLGVDETNFGQAIFGENHFSLKIEKDNTVSVTSASAYADYRLKNVEQLVFANKTVRLYKQETISSDATGFALLESVATERTADSSQQQTIRVDGQWTPNFLADASALLQWHQNPANRDRNTELDGYALQEVLEALLRGLAGSERDSFVQLVGLIADCKILVNGSGQSVPSFDGNFI
ncbi:MAG: hypothetical protein EBW71_07240 [Betaproteobacteria bacterium]|nr:hypothetical protein [Betaproteobacteria bacterium]NCW98766.1 hypothetical protein [Betaproteobacteria bacterium]NDE53792.1 hypothetical protein [Actinomycetota bacterium]